MNKLLTFSILFFIVPFICSAQRKSNQEINRIISTLGAGETFNLPNGEYNDLQIKINNKTGITIKAQTNGRVKLTGNSFIIINSSENVSISGFLFNETNSTANITIQKSNGVTVTNNYFNKCGNGEFNCIIMIKDGSSKNNITRNTFNKNRTMGVRINDYNNFSNIVSFNIFLDIPRAKDVYPRSSGNGLECIMVGSGKHWDWNSNTVIKNNYFKNVIGDATEIISLKSNANNVMDNYFENSKGGISLRLGNNSIIENNSFNNTVYPVRVYGDGHKIVNNDMKGGIIGIQLPGGDSDPISTQKVASYFRSNNITIKGNTISNFKESVVVGRTGGKNRNLMPNNITMENNTFDHDNWLVTDNKRLNSLKSRQNRIQGISQQLKKLDFNNIGASWKVK